MPIVLYAKIPIAKIQESHNKVLARRVLFSLSRAANEDIFVERERTCSSAIFLKQMTSMLWTDGPNGHVER